LDASVGSLRENPFAPGVTGNTPSGSLLHMLHKLGIETEIDLQALIGCAQLLEELLKRELPVQVVKAGICGHLMEGL
jgi:hydroxymethylglutaryl-CoA lyase